MRISEKITPSQAYLPTYEQEIFDFEKLSTVEYVINNDPLLTYSKGLKLLYAMELGKPIILSSAPQFAQGCLPFVRESITNRLNKIYIANIEVLDSVDSAGLLSSIQSSPVNYLLTRHQKAILHSYIRLHLRSLAPTEDAH